MHVCVRGAVRVAPAGSRPRGGLLGQVALVVAAWLGYSFARSVSGGDVPAAVRHGWTLLDWDRALGFGWTLGLNGWVSDHALIAVPLAFEYASLHYVVTPLVLVWLWRRRPARYRPALTALLAMTAIGLAFYVLLPVAPPRLLPGSGWVDTLRVWSHVGWWGGAASAPAGMEGLTNQYAAMPSLHVGWALWCAWAWRDSSSLLVRRFGWLYPASVSIAVVATANHYVLDVVAGALLSLAACVLVPRLTGVRARPRRIPRVPAVRPVGPGPVRS